MGILVEEDNPMGYVEVNRELNADNPEEQKRLKEAFPKEDDIIQGEAGASDPLFANTDYDLSPLSPCCCFRWVVWTNGTAARRIA